MARAAFSVSVDPEVQGAPLGRRLPPLEERGPDVSRDDLLERFLDYVAEKGLSLYPAQEEALLELAAGKNVILATPTGSGKSLVALAAHFFSVARGERAFYTSPIKALASEKFFSLVSELGADEVGMMTGDASVNGGAPIICCTAEVLASIALREGAHADVGSVVMDEFHYYADKDRGVAWQVPLLTLPQASFLLMSATLGDVDPFLQGLESLTGKPSVLVRSGDRPVPLDFEYRETPLHETVAELARAGKAPIYIVSFTQRGCAEEAQNLMSTDFCTKEQKRAIAEAVHGVRFAASPYGRELSRFVRHGVGIHHAGLLPKYRLLVEKLAQRGLLKVICGTDTLGVGVNIPIRTVLFTKLCKFDGQKTAILSVRDFHQIAGRAGRKGFDDRGSVVAQAPEHVIENLRMEAKASGDPKKLRKLVKKKPPDRGYVPWDKATFDRLVASKPESLKSSFAVSHGMLLQVLAREGGGCRAMQRLVRDSHEREAEKRIHGRTALAMFHSLVDAGIVRVEGGRARVDADLQEDFSLHHALSLYLLDTLDKLDPDAPTYALDVLTLVESILENPDVILARQLDRLKGDKIAELKMQGVEYDDRMAELEKLEYPKPLRDFVYDTFNAFAAKHPWVGQDNIRPKSIGREMVEKFLSFSDYVKEYDLQRSEGLLLRYLSDVYKTLVQTVPERVKDEAIDDLVVFFGAMVRQVDSSLLDEWESLRKGPRAKGEALEVEEPEGSRDITRDRRAFTVLVRNDVFRFVRAIARRDYETAASLLGSAPEGKEGAPLVPPPGAEAWTASKLEAALAPYFAEYYFVQVDAEARAPKNTRVDDGADPWRVDYVLLDGDGPTPWALQIDVDLARSGAAGRPVLELRRVGP